MVAGAQLDVRVDVAASQLEACVNHAGVELGCLRSNLDAQGSPGVEAVLIDWPKGRLLLALSPTEAKIGGLTDPARLKLDGVDGVLLAESYPASVRSVCLEIPTPDGVPVPAVIAAEGEPPPVDAAATGTPGSCD